MYTIKDEVGNYEDISGGLYIEVDLSAGLISYKESDESDGKAPCYLGHRIIMIPTKKAAQLERRGGQKNKRKARGGD